MFGERFQCPECGGSSFGSTLMDPQNPATSAMHRNCHGDDAEDGVAGCKFNWPDEDDWKYFLTDGRRLTQKEHEAIRAKIRGMAVEGRSYQTPRVEDVEGEA